MIFQPGEVLKFSEQGLREWTGTTKGERFDKCREWRWELVGFSDEPECRQGNENVHCLRLRRIDIKTKAIGNWSPDYFEKDTSLT